MSSLSSGLGNGLGNLLKGLRLGPQLRLLARRLKTYASNSAVHDEIFGAA